MRDATRGDWNSYGCETTIVSNDASTLVVATATKPLFSAAGVNVPRCELLRMTLRTPAALKLNVTCWIEPVIRHAAAPEIGGEPIRVAAVV